MTSFDSLPVHRRLLLGGGVAGLAGLAACGNDNRPGAMLRFAAAEQHEESQTLLDETLAEFTARTGRAVRFEPAGWEAYPDLLSQQLAGTDPPDLVLMPTAGGPARQHLATYAQDGRLLALDPLVPDPLDLTDLSEPALALGRVGGVQYAVPAALGTLGMAVDHDVFDRAGVDRLDGPVTWDELFDLCVRITENTPETTLGTSNQLGLRWVEGVEAEAHAGVFYEVGLLEYWLRQRGSALFTADGQLGFDPADLTSWFTYWTELAAAGGCPSYEGWRTGRQDRAWGDARPAAFSFYSLTATGYLWAPPADELPWAEPPRATGPDVRPGHAYHADSLLAIPAGAGDPAASADLLHALVLDPATAPLPFGISRENHYAWVWNGAPPAARVREAMAVWDPPPPPVYQEAVALVVELGDQGGEPPAVPPPTARLVLEELSLHADLVGTGELSVADGVDSFFTTAASLL